jgi:cystathionine beta-lyase
LKDESKKKPSTLLTHAGRAGAAHFGAVNTPVYHASTILFDSYEDIINNRGDYTYGRRGTPTTRALEEVISGLEHADGTLLLPSGLAACTLTLLALCKQGDHVLVPDNAYESTRSFSQKILPDFGIETEIYDPTVTDISPLIRDNTALIFLESPGSQTFELMDLQMIIKIAQENNILTAMDNTWASPLFCKPLDMGVDVSVQSATKYVSGHADCLLGYVSARKEIYARLKKIYGLMGFCVGPDDVAMTLRGVRTLDVRLKRHQESALKIAKWLEKKEQVKHVHHPALKSHPQHDFWKRDFSGAGGLFAIELHPCSETQIAAMLDDISLFGMGYSWGGYESLMIPVILLRQLGPKRGPLLRLHIGLEDAEDLLEDLNEGFKRFDEAKP